MSDENTRTCRATAEFYGHFSCLFRIQVHQLMAWGYEDVCCRIRSDNEEEPALTGFIAEAIQDRLRAGNCPRWCNTYCIHEDPPVRRVGTEGKCRPRPDIVVESILGNGRRPEYFFEAKRLSRRGHGAGKYVAEDGMGCFISGVYASRYNEAAMLGYVQSDSLPAWKEKLQNAMNKNRTKLRLKPPQSDHKVIEAFPLEWMSEHERSEITRSIMIYHILLDCRCQAVNT
jgi:hypothetical protein